MENFGAEDFQLGQRYYLVQRITLGQRVEAASGRFMGQLCKPVTLHSNRILFRWLF